MKRLLALSLAIVLAVAARAVLSGDSEGGRRLHGAACTGCHGADVYTRASRRVASLEGLERQTAACAHQRRQALSTAQVQMLVRYLDDRFYRFASGAGTGGASAGPLGLPAPQRSFEVAMKIAAAAASPAMRDEQYARIVDEAIRARNFLAADRAARSMSTPALRDQQFNKITGSCPAN